MAPLVALVVGLCSCGAASDADAPAAPTGPSEVGAGPGAGLTAVATVYPLAALAEETAPGADVRLLTSSGQDPHDLELSPADRRLVESADVVLYMGDLDFQPQVEAAVADATGQVVSVAAVAGAANLLDPEGHEEEGDDHEEAVDPHLWFDAAIMAEVAGAIGQAFAAADADGAEGYRQKAAALRDELLALDEDIDELFSECAHDTAYVSHEAYGYLLERRGLEQEGISGTGGHGDASPQRLAELTERIRARDVNAVLAEPSEGRGGAEALANEAGVSLLEIDPLEIGQGHTAGMRFPDALRAQAETFATALECR